MFQQQEHQTPDEEYAKYRFKQHFQDGDYKILETEDIDVIFNNIKSGVCDTYCETLNLSKMDRKKGE